MFPPHFTLERINSAVLSFPEIISFFVHISHFYQQLVVPVHSFVNNTTDSIIFSTFPVSYHNTNPQIRYSTAETTPAIMTYGKDVRYCSYTCTRQERAEIIPRSDTTQAFAPNSPAEISAPRQSSTLAPRLVNTTISTGMAI